MCVLFSCSEEEDQMEDCRFSFVTFRQSSGMLNYTSTVNSRRASFGSALSLSLSPSLSGGENKLQKTEKMWKNKRKIVSTLRISREYVQQPLGVAIVTLYVRESESERGGCQKTVSGGDYLICRRSRRRQGRILRK